MPGFNFLFKCRDTARADAFAVWRAINELLYPQFIKTVPLGDDFNGEYLHYGWMGTAPGESENLGPGAELLAHSDQHLLHLTNLAGLEPVQALLTILLQHTNQSMSSQNKDNNLTLFNLIVQQNFTLSKR
jgi:hypothetical protein